MACNAGLQLMFQSLTCMARQHMSSLHGRLASQEGTEDFPLLTGLAGCTHAEDTQQSVTQRGPMANGHHPSHGGHRAGAPAAGVHSHQRILFRLLGQWQGRRRARACSRLPPVLPRRLQAAARPAASLSPGMRRCQHAGAHSWHVQRTCASDGTPQCYAILLGPGTGPIQSSHNLLCLHDSDWQQEWAPGTTCLMY